MYKKNGKCNFVFLFLLKDFWLDDKAGQWRWNILVLSDSTNMSYWGKKDQNTNSDYSIDVSAQPKW